MCSAVATGFGRVISPMNAPTMTDRIELPRSERAPGIARRFVGDRLTKWGLAHVAETAQLLVSELVTNAVIHARSSAILRIDATADSLRVTVVDHGPGTRRRTRAVPPPNEFGGRGLFIVDQLASRWGTGTHKDGNHVWFELVTS